MRKRKGRVKRRKRRMGEGRRRVGERRKWRMEDGGGSRRERRLRVDK